MIYKQERHSLSWICPKCNWVVATTYYSPIELDITNYTLNVIAQSDTSLPKIKCISKSFSFNPLDSKQALLNGTITITGNAPIIIKIRESLDKVDIKHHIIPKLLF